MKLIYNIDVITPPITGIGRYACSMIRAIAENSPETEIMSCYKGRLLTKQQTLDLITQVEQAKLSTQKLNNLPDLKHTLVRVFKIRSLAKKYLNYKYRRVRKKVGPQDIYHEVNFSFLNLPGVKVTTIHDVSVFCHPEFQPSDRVKHKRKEIKNSVALADAIIVHCTYIKNQIVNLLQVPKQKIYVISPGAAKEFKPRTEAETESTLERYDLSYKHYLLCVCTLEPRKNISGLIKAYRALPAQIKQQYPLVLVGKKGWLFNEIISEIKIGPGGNGRIVFLEYIPEKDLYDLYSGAKLFVYPSFYEGFGLPVLEALASEVPVITSNTSSLPAVCGNAGALINPLNISEITEAIENIINNPALYQQLKNKTLVQAQRYSWKNFGEQLANLYFHLNSPLEEGAEYPDDYWKEAYLALKESLETINAPPKVLVPNNFRLTFCYPPDTYEIVQENFDYDFILLHKGMISYLPHDIYLEADRYRIVFENPVFQLLKRDESPFRHFIYSGKFKSAEQVIKCKKLAFIHIPKTAGTSIIHVLRQILPSLAYVAHPKQLPNYHLNHYSGLAGHLHFEELQKSNFNPDLIFSIIRHPKARLISTFCHVRREQNSHDFSPAMKAMKQQTIMDFMQLWRGAYEVHFVSRYLGGSEPLYCDTPEVIDHMQKKAISNIEKYNIILFDANKLDSFERFILKEFDTKIEIPHKNVNQEMEQYFSQQELDFINDGLDCYLEKEVTFYQKLKELYLYD